MAATTIEDVGDFPTERIKNGTVLRARMSGSTALSEARVLSFRSDNAGKREYFVHFVGHNKRLDEWLDESQLDCSTVALSQTTNEHLGSLSSAPIPIASRKRKRDERTTVGNKSSSRKNDKKYSATRYVSDGEEDENAPIRNIEMIELGRHRIQPWYFSPFPEELTSLSLIYICDFCLQFKESRTKLQRHRAKCKLWHPPGNEVYRDNGFSFFEIDGRTNRPYAENLCLLAKLFLDHKLLEYDTTPFLFYVLTENDERGFHIAGYFSKSKESPEGFNLSCLLVLPPYQKKGYGRLLIDFSYALSKREGKPGTPEKPISDLGMRSYRSYWSEVVVRWLLGHSDRGESFWPASDIVRAISEDTGVSQNDISFILEELKIIKNEGRKTVIVLSDELVLKYLNEDLQRNRVLVCPSKISLPERRGRI